MMTNQEIFDAVARHLTAQGYRGGSFDPKYGRFMCEYRTKNGDRCAIGALIPDEKYSPNVEVDSADSDLVMTAIGLDLTTTDEWTTQLLTDLQNVHDRDVNWQSPQDMTEILFVVAGGYDLDASILDRLDFGLIVPSRLDR